MAREYSIVLPQFWTGTTGRKLRAAGRDAQLVALYLITSPHANMIGLYHVALPTIGHETGLPIEGASKALRSLEAAGFALYDEEAEEVWVPEMARYQIAESLDPKDKRCKGVAREAAKFRKSRFYRPFLDRYAEPFHLVIPAPDAEGERPESPSEAPSKALRSQDQDQDQDQDQQPRARAHEPDPPPPAPRPTQEREVVEHVIPRRVLVVEDEGGVAKPAADSWPLTAQFRQALANRMGRTALHSVGGGSGFKSQPEVFQSVEASLRVLGIPDAVELCHEATVEQIRNGGRQPWTLAWFAQLLASEVVAKKAKPKGLRKVVGVDEQGQPVWALPQPGDPDFNDQDAWPDTAAFHARRGPALPVPDAHLAVRRVEP